ncbi:hypothetical protein PENNAL_c0037G08141 [Penicillium nalgiovense]|uniref:Plastocyanin-like domain-containing protein n=1 Tax=Penicillium nalgiovense TaxID=60175 RepID=A0A1V6Y4K3_PENNA|nr:hypothetical protein PENNAL_c0037G08141 [Penicillium nalgiovense]
MGLSSGIPHDLTYGTYWYHAHVLEPQVTIRTKNRNWVDLLLQLCEIRNSPAIQTRHVMHKQPNKGFIIGVGPGLFNWSSSEEANTEHPEFFQLDNPLMRDTSLINGPNGPTWMIVRYQVVYPGRFLFHCHIHTHMVNGMAVSLLDGIDVRPRVPESEHQSPRPWTHSWGNARLD